MGKLLITVSALILSFGLLLAGNSLQFAILGLRANHEGFSVAQMGLITSAYFAGFGVGGLYCTPLLARIGHIRMFAAAASAVSALILALALFPDPWIWMLLRLLAGACFAALYTVVESWLNARVGNEHRGRLLAIYAFVAFGGYAIGPLLANLGNAADFKLFVVASIIVSVALIPVTMTRFEAPLHRHDPTDAYSLARLLRETPLGFVGVGFVGLCQGSHLGLAPVFGDGLGMGASEIATLMSLSMFAGLAVQLPIGWLSDKFDRRKVIACVTIAGGSAILFFGITVTAGRHDLTWVLASGLAVGATIYPIYAILVAHTNDALPENSIVPAAAAVLLVYSISSTFGGIAGAAAMDVFGSGGLYFFMGGLMLMLGLFTLYRMTQRHIDETDGYSIAPASPGTLPIELVVDDEQLALDLSK